VDPAIAEEEEGREPFAARCDRWRRTVNLFGRFFEASLGDDRERPGPAATLTDQHRMHPHIADLVGRVFYPDQQEEVGTILVSPRETHERFESAPPFLTEPNTWLPAERVVWCDVPWRQKTKFAEGESDGVFSSPTEVRAVIAVLEQLRPKGREPCDIQVLSPYNDQLIAIREALGAARAAGRLAAMYSEPLNFGSGKRAGATVDEFQGSEADVVIVSLVRNNPLVPWKSVGFLKEANRMNVLLSRARHKLVIVGSWEFFRSRVDSETPLDAEYRYLGDMMKEMERAKRQGRLARIEFVP
jgi:superfamily I DNA and/or RNA helicase